MIVTPLTKHVLPEEKHQTRKKITKIIMSIDFGVRVQFYCAEYLKLCEVAKLQN